MTQPILHHSLPDEYLKAIGQIVVYDNSLEIVLRNLIYALSGTEHDVVDAFVAGRRTKDLLKHVKSLYKLRETDKALRKQVDDLMGKLEKIMERRDTIVHSAWGINLASSELDVYRYKVRANTSLERDLLPYSLEELHKLADDQKTKIAEIGRIMTDYQSKNALS